MKIKNTNSATENKPKLIFVSFTNTKRTLWANHRRYAS